MNKKIAIWIYNSNKRTAKTIHNVRRCRLFDHLLMAQPTAKLEFTLNTLRD